MKNLDDPLKRIGEIAIKYYNSIQFNPTQKDFELWIESLKDPMKSNFKAKGINFCKNILNFKRFIFELNDIGMEEFMKNNLSQEDYQFWLNHSKT